MDLENIKYFGDILILSAIFFSFLALSYFRFFNSLERLLLSSVIALSASDYLLWSGILPNFISNFRFIYPSVFLSFLILFYILFRKLSFNFSFGSSHLSRIFLSLALSMSLLYFMSKSFTPNFLIYDLLPDYLPMILSDLFRLFIVALFILNFIFL